MIRIEFIGGMYIRAFTVIIILAIYLALVVLLTSRHN